jgi:hypothetical protein
MRQSSQNNITNSLSRIWFPFMLINGAPLRHDRNRIQSARMDYDALPHGAVGAI